MWIDDDINLEPYFSITPVGRFWLVKTYQYGWHPSVLSHHAIGTAECDESYCIEGFIFDRSFVCMRGIILPWVILQGDRHHDHIWIFEHSNFLWRQFRGGVMSFIWHMGGSTHIWVSPSLHRFLGRLKNLTPYYS